MSQGRTMLCPIEKLQKSVNHLLKELRLKSPFDASDFKERLEQIRGYRIFLQPTKLPLGEYFGFWTHYEDAHYVFYREDARWLHQQQIIFHELAHILLNHPSPDYAKLLTRSTVYTEAQEGEAEIFANILMTTGMGWQPSQVLKESSLHPTPEGKRMEEFIMDLWASGGDSCNT